MTKDEWYKQLFERLENSRFRSRFHLKQNDIDYIHEKGLDTIRKHAEDFITKREAPAYIPMMENRHPCAVTRYSSHSMQLRPAAGNASANGTRYNPAES